MPELLSVPIDVIDANPFRLLAHYPYNERKLEILQRSIADVGLWEGVIARFKENRYEIAFGHHRVEAARRSGLEKVILIVRDLNDEQMLQFMGRENMEEYNAEFILMLETWEAGSVFCPSVDGRSKQPIDVARLLGWTATHSKRGTELLNNTARACNAAYALIAGGYINRDDLSGISVSAGCEIVERAQARIEQLEKLGKQGKRSDKEIEGAKQQVGKGAKETVRQYKDGQLSHNNLRGQVDANAYRQARKSKKTGPLLTVFAKNLADGLAKLLKDDTNASKLAEIQKVVADITLDEDKQLLARIDFELNALAERSQMWQRRMVLPSSKVVSLQQISKED
jgi:ParB-like chromosome segregation protein Spo0J